jgi:hypothetical protein
MFLLLLSMSRTPEIQRATRHAITWEVNALRGIAELVPTKVQSRSPDAETAEAEGGRMKL